MSGSLAQDAIALLIDLANRGEIDPWDVQVIEVIDRYLSELIPVGDAGQLQREAALSQSGQAFLYASMLVLLKADSLANSESQQAETDLAEDAELLVDGEDASSELPAHLERQLRRRAVAPAHKKRRVTLQELIDQLQLMSMEMEKLPHRARHRQPSPESTAKAVRAIAELANQENLSEIARELEQFLALHWTDISPDGDWLELSELLERWTAICGEPHSGAAGKSEPPKQHDRVSVFWALLLLSAQSTVELAQEEFYEDLKIRALKAEVSLEAR